MSETKAKDKIRTTIYIDKSLYTRMRTHLLTKDKSFSSWVEDQMRAHASASTYVDMITSANADAEINKETR